MTSQLIHRLDTSPALALLGPRQVGKTTLALEIAASRPSLYLDFEAPSDRAKLAEPELYLAGHGDELVILDEVHRMPEIFQSLRGLIDRGRRRAQRRISIAAPPVPRSTCCWRSPAARSGRSKSNAACRPVPKRASTSPARISSQPGASWSIRGPERYPLPDGVEAINARTLAEELTRV